MSTLELNNEYFVKEVKKTKYGFICITLNTSINFKDPNDDQKIRNLDEFELKDDTNSIRLYGNKSLNELIEYENVKQFCIRIINVRKLKISWFKNMRQLSCPKGL